MLDFPEMFKKQLAPLPQMVRGRSLRRAFPIVMYVGKNGSGKSAAMVYDTLPDLDGTRRVLSTVRLLDYQNIRYCEDDNCDDIQAHDSPKGHAQAHPNYVKFTDWTQLMDWRDGTVLMDEITGIADSQGDTALPGVVANKLAQLRRDDCNVRISGLNFVRANKRIREATTAVVRAQSVFAKTVYAEDGTDLMWQQRRYSVLKTYDAQTLPTDDHTDEAYRRAEILNTSKMWLPDSPGIYAYDTYSPVDKVGYVSDAGRCVQCDGLRRQHECSCKEYQIKKISVSNDISAVTGRKPRTTTALAPEDRRLPVGGIHVH